MGETDYIHSSTDAAALCVDIGDDKATYPTRLVPVSDILMNSAGRCFLDCSMTAHGMRKLNIIWYQAVHPINARPYGVSGYCIALIEAVVKVDGESTTHEFNTNSFDRTENPMCDPR